MLLYSDTVKSLGRFLYLVQGCYPWPVVITGSIHPQRCWYSGDSVSVRCAESIFNSYTHPYLYSCTLEPIGDIFRSGKFKSKRPTNTFFSLFFLCNYSKSYPQEDHRPIDRVLWFPICRSSPCMYTSICYL